MSGDRIGRGVVCVALALPLAVPALAAARFGGITAMVEGMPALIRAATVYSLQQGTILAKGDVVATGQKTFVQLEFDGGSIVALGPSSLVLITELPEARGRGAPQVVLLHGWAKIELPKASESEGMQVWSRTHGVTVRAGSSVIHVVDRATMHLFVETGSATLTSVGAERRQTPVPAGQFVVARDASTALEIRPRATPDFVTDIPHAFRDTLPPMSVRIAPRADPGTRLREVTYDDVAELLALPSRWRNGFVRRFEARLRDPAFRRGVEASMSQHPEWDRVLHPEKYVEDPSAPGTRPVGAAAH